MMTRGGARLLVLTAARTAVALLLHAATASAQVPGALPVQGYLTDASDTPLDGSYPVTFRLYDAGVGGTVLLEETASLAVRDGYFSLALGEDADLAGLFLDVGEVYLGVQVGTDAEIAPRTPILTAPYAFNAANAANAELLGGLAASAFSPAAHAHDFSSLSGIPAGLLDGDDVGRYYAGAGLILLGDTFQVDAVAFQRRIATGCPAGQFMTGAGESGAPTCSAPPDAGGDGDITEVRAGFGLVGGATYGAAELAIDASYTQRRVSSSCAVGSAIRTIAWDGTVTCQSTTATTPTLQCTRTSYNSVTIAAGASGTAYSPTCAAGYTWTSGACATSTSTTYLNDHSTSGGSTTTACTARNTGTSSSTVTASALCCRVQ